MRKSVLFFAAAAALLAAASCTKSDLGLEQKDESSAMEIGIRAYKGSLSKAGITSTSMPTTRQIVVSTHQYSTDPSIDSAYFTGITFIYDASGSEGKWREGKYWPKDGSLDFLAFSFEGYESVAHPAAAVPNIVLKLEDNYDEAKSTYPGRTGVNPTSVVWGDNNINAGRVVITVPDNSEGQDDILYASASSKTYSSSGTAMEFKHAEAALAFVPYTNIAYNDTINVGITLESIKIDTVKFSGKLTVNNPAVKGGTGDLTAEWSDLGSTKTKYEVPSIKNYPLPLDSLKVDIRTEKYAFGANYCNTYSNGFAGEHPWAARNAGVILPPQPQQKIVITYLLHNGMDAVGNKINTRNTYTYEPTANTNWEMGKKYVYNIKIGLKEITIAPTVCDWTDESQQITIDPFTENAQ